MRKSLLFSLAVIFCWTLAVGQSHMPMKMQHPAGGVTPVPHSEKMMLPILAVKEFLGLTDDQVKQWEALQQARQEQMAAQREQIKDMEQQLQEQLKLANPSATTVGELVIKLNRAREEGNQLMISFASQVRALLTQEQMKKLETVEQAFQLQKITGALFASGFLAPPPPPPPPAPPVPHAPMPPMHK